jgi:pimeloyl-ACP methyl ester carboxylesterase
VLAALATPSTARRGLAPEPAAVVRQAVHHRRMAAPRQPVLLVAGDRDPLLPAPTLHAFSTALAAELRVVEGGGHWPHAGAGWERVVGIVHRWLVRRLGEPLLERYAEAMAEREADDDGN